MNPQFTPPPHRKTYQYIVWDADGNPMLIMDSGESITFMESDGTIREIQTAGSLLLSDRTVWHPGMARGPTPVHLAVCSHCGQWISQGNAESCQDCGAPSLCPEHRRWSGGVWRCIDCTNRRKLGDILRWPFFKREGG